MRQAWRTVAGSRRCPCGVIAWRLGVLLRVANTTWPRTTCSATGVPGAGIRNFRFADGSTLFGLLRAGRHVQLDLTGTRQRPDTAAVWHSCPLAADETPPDWTTARIRPDGHLA
jgi:hypothetical protein